MLVHVWAYNKEIMNFSIIIASFYCELLEIYHYIYIKKYSFFIA